eukprot:gene5815-9638_t
MKIQTNNIQTTNICQHDTLVNDPYVLRKVLWSYENYLHLNENRFPNSRKPLKFIGKVKRIPLDVPTKTVSKTLDIIFIYQRNLQHKGYTMPICFQLKLVTTWKNGTPINHSKYDNETIVNDTYPNYLCCLPIFSLIEENKPANYQYFISSEDISVGYSDFYSRLLQHALPIEKISENLASAYNDVEYLHNETVNQEREIEQEEQEKFFFEQLKVDEIVKITIFEYNPLKQQNIDELFESQKQPSSSSEEEEEEEEEDDLDEEEEEDDEDFYSDEEEEEGSNQRPCKKYVCKYSRYNKQLY